MPTQCSRDLFGYEVVEGAGEPQTRLPERRRQIDPAMLPARRRRHWNALGRRQARIQPRARSLCPNAHRRSVRP